MQTNYQSASMINEGIELAERARAEVFRCQGKSTCRQMDRGLVSECQSLAQWRAWEEVAWLALGASAFVAVALSLM